MPERGINLVPGMSMRFMPDGRPVVRCHYSAHPERGPEWLKQERGKVSSQGRWDREQEIIHEAGGGERVFAEIFSNRDWMEKILIDPQESQFQLYPGWNGVNGFDHGTANPTAALVTKLDYDGTIYVAGEYYQPGLSPRQHVPNLLDLKYFTDHEAMADPSIFFKNQRQSDGSMKAYAQLYADEGITNLVTAPDNTEITGMERILAHWLDLDHREPTLKILCPRHLREIVKPIYGVHNGGCPNLLWELRRTKRVELTPTQLTHQNPSERIVDKDNHLRDCLKYICLSLPEPSHRTPQQIAEEAIKHIPREDVTSRLYRYQEEEALAKQEEEDEPIRIGRSRR